MKEKRHQRKKLEYTSTDESKLVNNNENSLKSPRIMTKYAFLKDSLESLDTEKLNLT